MCTIAKLAKTETSKFRKLNHDYNCEIQILKMFLRDDYGVFVEVWFVLCSLFFVVCYLLFLLFCCCVVCWLFFVV